MTARRGTQVVACCMSAEGREELYAMAADECRSASSLLNQAWRVYPARIEWRKRRAQQAAQESSDIK